MDLAELGAIGAIVILLVIGLSIFVYFLPSYIAGKRKAQNGCAIFIVNLLFGWTFLGWIVTLIWAIADSPKQDVVMQNYVTAPPPGYNPAAQRTCPNCGRMVRQGATTCPHCRYNMARRMKACPYCGEDILYSAIKCRYCQSDLPAVVEDNKPPLSEDAQQPVDTTARRRSLADRPSLPSPRTPQPCPNPECGNRFVTDKCSHCGTSIDAQAESGGTGPSRTPQPCPNPKCANQSVISKCAACGTTVR